MPQKNQIITLITGLSGAGISTALKGMEDIGFEVFDNFPVSLIRPLLQDKQHNEKPIAIGLNSRTRGFIVGTVMEIANEIGAKIIFLNCDTQTLETRFTETRRQHPLAGIKGVLYGITKEQKLLKPLRETADLVIDTSALSIHDLRRILKGHFDIDGTDTLNIGLVSFGFKNGTPRMAEMIMDVRFLQNPHWVTHLKPLTGKDKDVAAYIKEDVSYEKFINRFTELLETLLPRYAEEGKKYLTIAIGCTGGKHRSVHVVETLKPVIENNGFKVSISHRDIEK